ncbi:MAG: T9SS type A sorting domain-containing protein [Bacteroidia bacterium]
MRNLICYLVSCFTCFSVSAQTPLLKWKSKLDGTSYVEDRGAKVLFDLAGNVVVCGYEENGCTENDIALTKYNPAGDTLWHASFDGSGTYGESDYPYDMEMDAAGNIYIAGSTELASFNYAVTLKYDPSGNLVWSKRYSAAYSTANALTLDASGNVIVCGYREISNNKDYLLIKYDANGNELWSRFYSNGNHDMAVDVVCDNTGNVFVTGRRSGVNPFYDWATLKYDASGNQLWVDVFGNAIVGYSEEPTKIALDSNGDLVVVGLAPFLSTSNRDYYLIKYNSAGSRLWESPYTFNNSGGDDYPLDMDLDLSGNIYVTGNSIGNATAYDIMTVKFNAAGQFQWTARLDSIQQSDYARSVEVDPSTGDVVVLGDMTVSNAGILKRDWVLARYSSAGSLIKKSFFDGPANDFDPAADLAISNGGDVVATGMVTIHGGGFVSGDQLTIRMNGLFTPIWSRFSNGNSFADDQLSDLYVDAFGNAYVTGFSKGGENTLEDFVVAKFNAQGSLAWTYLFQGFSEISSDKGIAITGDINGRVYVTGSVDSLGGNSVRNIYTAALDSNGVLLWDVVYAGSAGGADYPVEVVPNGTGGVYVAGVTVNTNTGLDATVLNYDGAGNLQWSAPFHKAGGLAEGFTSMVVDATGNVYAAGFHVPSGGDLSNGLLVKFNAAGSVLWDTTYDFGTLSNDRDFFNSIALDLTGQPVVAGQSNFDFVTAQYSTSGSNNWIQNYSHSNNADSATVVKVDADNNILVGGVFGQFIEGDFGIVKYRNDGTLVWDRRYANAAGSDDILLDMAVDGDGNVYACGWETNAFSTNYNFMTVVYDSAGVFKYELLYTDSLGVGPDYGKRIFVDDLSNIYIAGDANENCLGNTFINGFRWDLQVMKYGPNSGVGMPEQVRKNGLRVYPNPASDLVRLQWASENELAWHEVTVFNASGQVMIRESIQSNTLELPVSGYPSGLYLVRVSSSEKTFQSRFVVE